MALVESAREAEDQLKITALELSRLKVALTQAEKTGSQWKGAAENLRSVETFGIQKGTKKNPHFLCRCHPEISLFGTYLGSEG